MKMRDCDVIVVRTFGAEHVKKGGYWLSWYMDNVIRDDANLGRIRGYWKAGCIDALLVPDRETAEDIALSYEGPLSVQVRGMAACLALGENPDSDSDGGQHAVLEGEPLPMPPGGDAVTLDSLMN